MKKKYNKALCIKNDIGYERVLIIGKVYEIIDRTNRYVTVKTEVGNIERIWKGYFKLYNDAELKG